MQIGPYIKPMIKSPRNIKYRKYQRNYLKGGKNSTSAKLLLANKTANVCFGLYGLQSNGQFMISLEQLESCRRLLRRAIGREAPVWIRAFPYKPLYKQDQGHRMGKGKGERYAWVCPIKKGQILFEIGPQVDISIVRKVFSQISYQLGVKTKLVHRRPH